MNQERTPKGVGLDGESDGQDALPRKKGYAGRYVRHELGKNKLNLLLGCVFLLGALVGCQLAGQDPETILSQLGSLFSATGQSAGFLDTVVASFAANAALLLILCLCGLGAVFQPLALGVAVLEGLGPRRVGVFIPTALGNVRRCSIIFWCCCRRRCSRCCCW